MKGCRYPRRFLTCSVSCTPSVLYLSVYSRCGDFVDCWDSSRVAWVVLWVVKCARSRLNVHAHAFTFDPHFDRFSGTRRQQLNILLGTAVKLGPRSSINMCGSTAADQGPVLWYIQHPIFSRYTITCMISGPRTTKDPTVRLCCLHCSVGVGAVSARQ